MITRIVGISCFLLIFNVMIASHTFGAENGTTPGQFDSTEELINLLKEKNIITDEEAAKFINRHRESAQKAPRPEKEITIVPEGEEYLQTITDNVVRDISDEVRRQVKEEIKGEIAQEVKLEAYTGSVPGWTKRIRWGGDIRLRYQGDFFDKGNAEFARPDNPSELLNSKIDRHRMRYRARLKVIAKVNNQVEAGIRLATGNEDDPISTNDTLGDAFNKDTVTFDRAYIKWNAIPETSMWTGEFLFWGGRIPNPFFYSDLVWDPDLNFEGVAMNLKVPFGPRFKALLNAGVFPLEEVEFSTRDKWLLGGQVGMQYEPRTTLSFKVAAAYYDYENITGKVNEPGKTINDFTAPKFQQKGNVVFDINPLEGSDNVKMALGADYKELNLTTELDIGLWDPIHIVLLGDYVKNLGFDKEEILQRTGIEVPEETQGYQVGLTVGYPKVQELWDWNTFLFYKYLEADAVLDAFTDSDFHAGGTNAKGWILGAELGLSKNFWLKSRWITTDEIIGPPFAIDTFQFDLNSRF